MKRLLIMLCVVAFLVALPMSHSAFAGKKAKVAICHVNSANDAIEGVGATLVFGKVIEVSENAVAAKEAKGDSAVFYPLTEELRDLLEELLGISLPNADCYFVVLD